MPTTKTQQQPHVSRPKTAAQRQRAAENIRAAGQRLEALQAKQKLANEARKAGFYGTDDQVIAKKAEMDQAIEASLAVNQILTACGVYRRRVEGFLAARINREPTFVLQKLNDFFSRPRNSDVKAYVEKSMNNEGGAA